MGEERPTTLTEYVKWLKAKGIFNSARAQENHYKMAAEWARAAFIEAKLWTGLGELLNRANDSYQLKHSGYPLLHTHAPPEVRVKPYQSAIEKTFRKNILQNMNFPQPPEDTGWVLPTPVHFASLGDVVRAQFVVKYADGVEYLAAQLKTAAELAGFTYSMKFAARNEGYYAAHITLDKWMELPKFTWDTEDVRMVYELQITTQLQEVILQLTHHNYETRRIRDVETGTTRPWEWDFGARDFSANYLGHILHYLEGVILDIRSKQEEEEA